MTKKVFYSITEFEDDSRKLAAKIKSEKYDSIYPVPQGGVPLGMKLSDILNIPLTDNPDLGTLIVDDLIDSGATRKKFPDNDFACLHVKSHAKATAEYVVNYVENDWIVYWWEGNEEKSIDDTVIRQLEFIDEDPNREGLLETPARVIKSWKELYAGYGQNPEDVMKTFKEGACDDMVLLKNIEMYSMCEHHILPFFGKAHIAYIPDGKVIGISKLARLLEIFSRRLQIQERIGEQVTSALMKYLQPKGAACIIEAQHFCMMARGIQKQNSIMVTSSLKGVFFDKLDARNELMGLIK